MKGNEMTPEEARFTFKPINILNGPINLMALLI